MSMNSLCDRLPLARLREWRLRLRQELQQQDNADSAANRRYLRRRYEALQIEIAEQNCKRQCAVLQRFKDGCPGGSIATQEMARWWWLRY